MPSRTRSPRRRLPIHCRSRCLLVLALPLLVLSAILPAAPAAAAPQSVILMIGDGMGFGHVEAARLYNGGPLAFETVPHQAQMVTDSYTSAQLGVPTDSAAAGYGVVTDRTGMQGLGPAPGVPVLGLLGEGMPFEWDYPHATDPGYDTLPFLREMTSAALSFLNTDSDGFFLMIEQGSTDSAGHETGMGPDRIGRDVFAVLELSRAVEEVLAFAAGRDDTLVIVTADHETGGLAVLQGNGPGVLPTVSWSTSDHTRAMVPVYAWGPNASLVSGILDNTDIRRIASVPEPATIVLVAGGMLVLALRGRRLAA